MTTGLTSKEEMEKWPWLWAETQPKQVTSQYKRRHLNPSRYQQSTLTQNHIEAHIFDRLCLPQQATMLHISWGIQVSLCFLLSACRLQQSNLVARNPEASWRQWTRDKAFSPHLVGPGAFCLSALNRGSLLPATERRGGPMASIHCAHLWHRAALCSTLGKNTQHSLPDTIHNAWPRLRSPTTLC